MYSGLIEHQIKRNRGEILEALRRSLRNNTAIGITIRTSKDMFTTSVLDIENHIDGRVTIVFQPVDLHGYVLQRDSYPLDDIERVIHFNIPFDDPVFISVRRKEQLRA